MHGFTGNLKLDIRDIEKELAEPTDMRIFVIADALEKGIAIDRIYELTKIDKWFLYKLKNIIGIKKELCRYKTLESVPKDLLAQSKNYGFSDFQIARHVIKSDSSEINRDLLKVRSSGRNSDCTLCQADRHSRSRIPGSFKLSLSDLWRL